MDRHDTWDFSIDGTLKSDLTEQGFFQDGGTVRFELYVGTVEIQRVHVFSEFGGQGYMATMGDPFTLVPEPHTAALAVGMFLGITLRRGRRRITA